MTVAWIFRSHDRHRFSIEKVFATIEKDVQAEDIGIQKYYLPEPSYRTVQQLHRNLRYTRHIKADLYHITGEVNFAALALPGRKCIITLHDFVGLDQIYRGPKRALLWLLWYYLPLRHCARIICISKRTEEETLQRFPFCRGKTICIPDPVSSAFSRKEYNFRAQCPRILIIGTTPVKNIHRMLQALEGIPCLVNIIGTLTEEQKCDLKTFEINAVPESDLDQEEIARRYEMCDLLLFASVYEGFGLPILEAQAIGRPVVTSNIEPMRSVAGNGACLVDPLNIDSIRDGVLHVIRDEKYRKDIVARGLVNVKKYNAASVAADYRKVYEDMLDS